MEPSAICALADRYASELRSQGVKPLRINESRTFRACTLDEVLAHALYLAENIRTFDIVRQNDKMNRHLAALQMCLSFSGLYTLQELMEHNHLA